MSIQQEAVPVERTETTHSGSGLRAWLSVLSVAVGVFSLVTTEFLPVGLLPDVARDFGITEGQAGLMMTMPGLVGAVAAPVILVATATLNRRFLLIALSLALLLSNLIAAVSPAYPAMLFSRALLGCCLGGYWTIVLSSSGHLVKPQDSARAIAIVLSGITLATVVGVPLGTYVGSLGTWRAAFLCTAVIVAIALIGQIFALPSLYARNSIGWSSLSTLLRQSAARRTLATVALIIAAHLAAYTYVTPFLLDDAKLSSETVPGILLAFGLVGLVANFGIARWAARAPGLSTIWVVGLFASCFLVLPIVAQYLFATLAVLVVWAACNGCIILCLTLWVGESTADHQEAGSAMFVSTVQIAIALGSVLGGVVVDCFGVPANFILGCIFAIGAGAFAFSYHTMNRLRRNQ